MRFLLALCIIIILCSCEKIGLDWNLPRSNQNDTGRDANPNGKNWPLAQFSSSRVEASIGESILFKSISKGNPDNFEWKFVGGNPLTSTQSEESVTYNYVGAYDVFLKIKNGIGSDSILKTKAVKIFYLKDFSNGLFDGWTGSNWFFSTSPTCPGCIYAWSNTSGSTMLFQLSKTFNTYSDLNDLEFFYNIYSPGGVLRVFVNGIEIWSDSVYSSKIIKLSLPALKTFTLTFQAEVGYTQTIYLNNIRIKPR